MTQTSLVYLFVSAIVFQIRQVFERTKRLNSDFTSNLEMSRWYNKRRDGIHGVCLKYPYATCLEPHVCKDERSKFRYYFKA